MNIEAHFMNGIGLGIYRHREIAVGVNEEDEEDVNLVLLDSITLQLPFCRVMFFTVVDSA